MASDETVPPAATDGAPALSAPKSKLPLIAAIVVGVAVGAGSGAVLLRPMFVSRMVPNAAVADSAAQAETPKEGEADGKGEHGGGGEGKSGATAPPGVLLENLVLNPAGSGGSRYLLMSIAIECNDGKGVELLTLRDSELRDVILTTMGTRTVEELSDIGFRDTIKKEILAAIGARFGKTSVKQMYFPQFVIQ